MERSVEVLAIILFSVLGLSHIVQPKAWAEFFILLRNKGESGALEPTSRSPTEAVARSSWDDVQVSVGHILSRGGTVGQ